MAEEAQKTDELPDIEPGVLEALEKADSAPAPEPAAPKLVESEPKTAETAAEPKADDLDVRFEKSFHALQEERKKLEEERRQVEADRGVRLKSEEIRGNFHKDPIAEIRRLAQAVVGDDEKAIHKFLKDEVYTPLMVDVLGVENADDLDPKIQQRAEMRRLERKLEAERQAREAERQEREKREKEAEESVRVQEVKGQIGRWLEGQTSDDGKSTYPFLAKLADSPTDDLYDVLLDHQQRGEEITPEKAAELADAYYRKRAERYASVSQLLSGQGDAARSTSAKATPGRSAKTTSLTHSGATAANAAKGQPDLEDEEASAEYWANMLEKDPQAILRSLRGS